MTNPEFSLNHNKVADNIYQITVKGELDVLTAPLLKSTVNDLIEKDCDKLLVDFTKTTFIDSTTLGVLIGTLKRLNNKNGKMVIACSDSAILKLIDITGLNKIFEITNDVDSALEVLK